MSLSPSDIDHHLAAFVDAFVVPARKERWRYLLAYRRKNTRRSSSDLMAYLDKRFCSQVDGAFGLDPKTRGVFYDFRDEPEEMSLEEAVKRGESRDALFSILPGALAIHWSHEGWSWICRRQR